MNLSEMKEFQMLKERVNNAEKMIQIFWALTYDAQPLGVQSDMHSAVEKFYNANSKLGSDFSSTQFKDSI